MTSPVTITATGGGNITINGGGGDDPPTGTKYVQVEGWAGGGGGQVISTSEGGGKGGGYAKKIYRGLTNGDILYYSNSAGSAPNTTADPTWVHKNTNTDASSELRAAGGGQTTTSNGTPVGDLTKNGGNGAGPGSLGRGGGGGGGAGADADGAAGTTNAGAGGDGGAPSGGTGGAGSGGAGSTSANARGGGGGGGGGASGGNGGASAIPSGGGGGGGNSGGNAGSGSRGQILFLWFTEPPYSHAFSTTLTNLAIDIYGWGWTLDIGTVSVTTPGIMFASTVGPDAAVLEGVTFGNDHKCSATLKALAGGRYAGLTVRHGAPGSGNYYGFWTDGTTNQFFVSSGGSHTDLTLDSGSLDDGIASDTELGLEASGDQIIVSLAGVELCRATDSTYTTGSCGFVGNSATAGTSHIENFSAENSAAAAYSLVCAVGAFTLAGQAANLLNNQKLTAAVGTFAETGITAGTLNNQKLTAAVGTFSEVGNAATTLNNHKILAVVGAFTLSGQATAFIYARYKLTTTVSAFAEAGVDVKIRKNHHQRRFSKFPDPWINLWW